MLNNSVTKRSFHIKLVKKISIPESILPNFSIFKNQKFIIIKKDSQQFYFAMPLPFNLIYLEGYLAFYKKDYEDDSHKVVHVFFEQVVACIRQLHRNSCITFLIRGVGLKISFVENNIHLLRLKFGYSHLIFLTVPENVLITLFKKKILLSSSNKVLLGNFSQLLYKYRTINVFTGKGLLKKQRKKFKIKEYVKKV